MRIRESADAELNEECIESSQQRVEFRVEVSWLGDQYSSNVKFKSSTFVIQKYIERPLLIYSRKFDIRIWVLYTQEKVYLFKEGYIRTAWEEFSVKEIDIDKQYIHLTNNAIQK